MAEIVAQRRSLTGAFAADRNLSDDVFTVDLWSTDDTTWRSAMPDEDSASSYAPSSEASAVHTVVLSTVGVETPDSEYLQTLAHREREFRAHRPDATVLRLGPVVEDLGVYRDSLREGRRIYHAYGSGTAAWISAHDVPSAVQACTAPQRRGGTYELVGAEPLSVEDLLERWAGCLGGSSHTVPVSGDALQSHLTELAGPAYAAAVVGHQQWIGSQATQRPMTSAQLTEVLGRAPTDVDEAIRRHETTDDTHEEKRR
ncbi:SDR family oxidoreductase [Nesterenkonia aerolata]|uniref:Uncharacterized protein n=1 Tax=Nesterenkonia aerolata TaxID=3074079 RepID=A0ABU2DSX1_9MICC|nr:hypothetical protein [Nesterenkonia sp. LY-0111]MDR8019390.1 hypothetical protein [Nesterenkonia sp. LY-0111]